MSEDNDNNAPTKDSHYCLCKKVAQLTKVIVQLNTLNENYTSEKECLLESHNKQIETYAADKQRLIESHDQTIKGIKEDVDGKIKSLDEEATAKELELKELNEQLTSVLWDAQTKVKQLQSDNENQRASHAQTVREISKSLEEQTLQHQENILCLRNQLSDEHKKRTDRLKLDLNASHEDEIQLIKSRHSNHIRRLDEEALENQKLAVDNAVAMARLEHEKVLSHMQTAHNEKCETIKAETAEKMSREIRSVQEELEMAKVETNEMKSKLDVQLDIEKRLKSDVTRLQTSLDTMSASNRTEINDLQAQNTKLLNDARRTSEVLDNRLERIKVLEVEVNL